jgi:SulP family sulfate permease
LLKATRGDAMILIATAVATVALDLVTAVVIGLVVAALYALRQVAQSARVNEVPLDLADHSREEQDLLNEHVVAYRLDGPLFFGAARRFLVEIAEISDVRVVILRLSRVQTLDATGATVLGDTIKTLEARGITVLLSGIRDEHDTVFSTLGIYDHLAHERHVFAHTPEAIEHARAHVHNAHSSAT